MSTPRLGLIDYQGGNLRSVRRALEACGAQVDLVAAPAALTGVDALVLPGQGAFGDCITHLRAAGLWEPLAAWLRADRPLLAICVGFQILFERSEEAPEIPGLGHFAGEIRRLRNPVGDDGPGSVRLKVPHMGWDTLRLTAPETSLWRGLPLEPSVYFAHSYVPVPADPGLVAAWTDYGQEFASAVLRGRTAAMLFHPEKSQHVGLAILRNFLASLAS